MEFHIKVPVQPDFLSDVLQTALDGGISYWCVHAKVQSERVGTATQINQIDVLEEDETEYKPVTHQSLVEAIQKICEGGIQVGDSYRQSIYLAVTTNDAGQIDAGDADIIVQVAALGDIVYG